MGFRDDRYHWISPEGVMRRILYTVDPDAGNVDGNALYYYIEKQPNWKVEAIGAQEGGIDACYVTGPSGKTYMYGNSAATSSNRYTLCWPETGYVGKGFTDIPDMYPFQWDLSSISDPYGNLVTFEYDTVGEGLSTAGWSTPDGVFYTKASYLKRIPSGLSASGGPSVGSEGGIAAQETTGKKIARFPE